MDLRRTARRRIVLAAAIAFMPTIGLPLRAGAVNPTADAFIADGADGYLGQNLRWNVTDATAAFTIQQDVLYTNGVEVRIDTGAAKWTFHFVPPQGETLHVGHYADAGQQTPTTSELVITRDSSGCNHPTGQFTV